jgi:hypothetical protein
LDLQPIVKLVLHLLLLLCPDETLVMGEYAEEVGEVDGEDEEHDEGA